MGEGSKGSVRCRSRRTLQVATPTGEQAIGTLRVGDQVSTYNPQTGQTSPQPVLHVWINHDSDLVDVTLRIDTSTSQPGAAASAAKVRDADLKAHGLRAPPAEQAHPQPNAQTDVPTDRHAGTPNDDTRQFAAGGKRVRVTIATAAPATHATHAAHATHATHASASASDETAHTTAKHPWLTTDRGFVPVAQLRLGERVVREDGTPATIVALRVVRVPCGTQAQSWRRGEVWVIDFMQNMLEDGRRIQTFTVLTRAESLSRSERRTRTVRHLRCRHVCEQR